GPREHEELGLRERSAERPHGRERHDDVPDPVRGAHEDLHAADNRFVPTPLSVLFLAKDEADRLPAALASVSWADEVVVADTGSSDATIEVARASGARVVSIPWEGWVASRNRALHEAAHDWVLFLDADERVSPELRDELRGAV